MSHAVSVVGSANYDIFLRQPRLPLAGETLRAEGMRMAPGGKGTNQAVQMARLGVDVGFVGCVGEDVFGGLIRAALTDAGVGVESLKTLPGPSGIAVVQYLPDGQVHATLNPGVNERLTLAIVEQADIWRSELLLLQLEIPMEVTDRLLREAHARGCCTVLNAAPVNSALPQAWNLASYLIVNEVEAQQLFGLPLRTPDAVWEARNLVLGCFRGTCVVTLGARGSVLIQPRESWYIPPVRGCVVEETTGAGDAYVGTFAARKLAGDSEPQACRYAARAAEITIGAVGAQTAMPTHGQVLERLAHAAGPETEPIRFKE